MRGGRVSAAETLFEEAKMHYAATFLGKNPEALDEAIALHYAGMAEVAFQMKKLVEYRRHCRDDNCEQCIAYMREQIRKGHMHAFGTHPNWPEPTPGESG